jgi:hypothetical protein
MNKRAVGIALRQITSQAQLTKRLRKPAFRQATPRRIIYMSSVRDAGGWHCRFHLDSFKDTIPRQFVFQNAEKLYETARRGNGLISMESRHDLDAAITKAGAGSG